MRQLEVGSLQSSRTLIKDMVAIIIINGTSKHGF